MLKRSFSIPSFLLLLGFAGCKPSHGELHFSLSSDTQKLPAEASSKVAATLEKYFGSPEAPLAHEGSGLNASKLQAAPRDYQVNCIHCHGVSGDGNGPTARFLYPRPRDFRRGTFKFTSTEPSKDSKAAAKPTRDDLMRTLKNGVNYTAMPSFLLYDETMLDSVLEYVMFLSMRGELERSMLANYESEGELPSDEDVQATFLRIAQSWQEAKDRVVVPGPATPYSAESVERGHQLFLKGDAQCISCHGPEGRGAAVKDQKDDWGFPTQAADLTRGVYRGGGRPVDLYRRIYSGIKGSPMPGFYKNLTNEQIWDIVHFVQSLNRNRT